ncbi:MAG: hypothetical protein P9M03_02150 [Candidatus Theseobacter exili]|nr:hypothetical protein [Candidatus Theseobacter exili]
MTKLALYDPCLRRILKIQSVLLSFFMVISLSSHAPICADESSKNALNEIEENKHSLMALSEACSQYLEIEKNRLKTDHKNVILIRDIHCHKEAQLNIASALKIFLKIKGKTSVFFEGACGPVKMSLFQAFPDKEAREKAGNYFVEKGLLSGAEYACLYSGLDSGLNLYGAENTSLYVENLKAFRTVRKIYDNKKNCINSINNEFVNYFENQNNTRMNQLYMIRESFIKDHYDFKYVVKNLCGIAAASGIEIDGSIREMLQVIQLGDEIDQKKIDAEQQRLLLRLEKNVNRDEIAKIIEMSLKFKLSRVGVSEYFALLRIATEKHGDSFEHLYPEMHEWLLLSAKRKKINIHEVWGQIISLVMSLLRHECEISENTKIFKIYSEWIFFRNLIELKITRSELPELATFSLGAFITGCEGCFGQESYKIFNSAESNLSDIARESKKFYLLASKRDRVLTSNMIEQMNKRAISDSVLISGGFHTEGIENILEQEGLGYLVLNPKAGQIDTNSMYEEIMMSPEYICDQKTISGVVSKLSFTETDTHFMLAAPVRFGELIKEIAKGAYVKFSIEMLQALIEAAAEGLEPYQLLDMWMQKGKSKVFLKGLSSEEIQRVLYVFNKFYPGNIIGQILLSVEEDGSLLKRIASEAIAKSKSLQKYPGLVALAKIYFEKLGSDNDVVSNAESDSSGAMKRPGRRKVKRGDLVDEAPDNSIVKISGGKRLAGTVEIGGSKQGILHILGSLLLADGKVTLKNVPDISDVHNFLKIYKSIGVEYSWDGATLELDIDQKKLDFSKIDSSSASAFRSSILLLGSYLMRNGNVSFPCPGGCRLGDRGMDKYYAVADLFGYSVEDNNAIISAFSNKEMPEETVSIDLEGQGQNKTALALILASGRKGETVIIDPLIAPDIENLETFLKLLGVLIVKEKTKKEGKTVEVVRVKSPGLNNLRKEDIMHKIETDRTEMIFWMVAAALTGGKIKMTSPFMHVKEDELGPLFRIQQNLLDEMNIPVSIIDKHTIEVDLGDVDFNPANLKTAYDETVGRTIDGAPHFIPLLTLIEGESTYEDVHYGIHRVTFAKELEKMGANIEYVDNKIVITGVENLKASHLEGREIRGTACLVLAALRAEGTSHIKGLRYLNRGYEYLIEKLQSLGAEIELVSEEEPKTVGASTKLEDNPIIVPFEKRREWFNKASETTVKTKNIKGRVIKAKFVTDEDMPEGIDGWHLRDNVGNLVIVTRNNHVSEAALHEYLEDFWLKKIKKGPATEVDKEYAHIVASAEQVLAYGIDGVTPYHKDQIKNMTFEELLAIKDEYYSLERETYHYRIISWYLSPVVLEKVKRYEAMFIEKVKEELERKLTRIIADSDVAAEASSSSVLRRRLQRVMLERHRQIEAGGRTRPVDLLQPAVAKVKKRGFGNLSLGVDYNVSGDEGISNYSVGSYLSETLTELGFLVNRETQVVGDSMSVLTEKIISLSDEDRSNDELTNTIADYIDNEFQELNKETRGNFEKIRLVCIGGQVDVARNESVSVSYAHFGMAGKDLMPTLYIGRRLLEYLLKHRRHDLNTLLRIEMNRMTYRASNVVDNRTSMKVVRDAGVSLKDIESLKRAIAEAEAHEIARKYSLNEILMMLKGTSVFLDKYGKMPNFVGGVDVGRLNDYVLDALALMFAEKIDEDVSKSVTEHIDDLKKKRAEKLIAPSITKMINILEEKIDKDCIGIEINTLSEEIYLFKKAGEKAEKIDLDKNDIYQVISRMVGKTSGDIEHIYIDLRRGNVEIRDALALLLEGETVAKESERKLNNLVAERIIKGENEVLHISAGKEGIRKAHSRAESYVKYQNHFANKRENMIPVGIDVSLLVNMTPDELEMFVNKYSKVLALTGDESLIKSIEIMFGEKSQELARNRQVFLELDSDNKVVVLGEDAHMEEPGASAIRIKDNHFGPEQEIVMDLAQYVASVGKSSAYESEQANMLLKQLLQAMYDEGEIPQELLTGMPLQIILDDPQGFLFPPIDKNYMNDVESYLRAKKYIEMMA